MLLLCGLSALLFACSPTPPIADTDCEPGGNMDPDCRFSNPEDMAATLDEEELIISQFGAMDGSRPGSLVSYDLDTLTITSLFPTGQKEWLNIWGDPDCDPPDQAVFAPHGIDFEELPDGQQMLLVVNHGGRESIEMFEVLTDPTSLEWRGCVIGPGDAYFNDVVAQHTGGFYVTHMMSKQNQVWALFKAGIFGLPSGHVYAWDRLSGFTEVPGTRGAMPNGIEKSLDERYLFVNMYLEGETRKVDLATGEVVGAVQLPGPDNVTWSLNDRLLVASHDAGLVDMTTCQDLESGSCGFSFSIVEIDPQTMTSRTLLSNTGPPMGAATVAVNVGDSLYLGTFAGDRITRARLSD
jgi:hypothetical protein